MTNSDFKIPQSELDRVTEAVCQGVVASKSTDSQFWGDVSKKFANIEKILATNAEATEIYRKTVDTHMMKNNSFMERVEPMISSYEKDNAFNTQLGITSKKWGIRIGIVASAIGSWYIIKAAIISILK